MKTFILGTGNFSLFKKLIDYNSEIIIFNSLSSLSDRLHRFGSNHAKDIPDMILGEFSLMARNDDMEVKEIVKWSKALHIPFFALSQEISSYTKQRAIQWGCNDIFHQDDDLDHIMHRLSYRQKSKYGVVFRIGTQVSKPQVRIPLLKRAFDIAFSFTVLMVLTPVMLLIALLVKLESKGPVLYISKRAGSGYHVFNFYKFRTMRHGADRELNELVYLNQYGSKPSTFIKLNKDPRVTTLGALLRKTSLDELPQFLNVLKGDMSIVGNRPLPLYEAEGLTIDQSACRFLAPAGITGLWQVTKRGRLNMSDSERKELDIQYANNYSVWVDFKILVRTLPALFQKAAV